MTTPALAQNVKGKGRHYAHPTTGDLVPSVTNVLSMLAKPALVGWAARTVAELAADLRDSLPKMERAEVVTLLKGAASRTGNKAATRGTDVHAFLEARLCGFDTPPLDAAAEQYRHAAELFLEHERPERIATEITTFTPTYAGTADAVVRIGGRTCLIDYKTSKAIYPEATLQLAALWSGQIWHDGKELVERVPIDELIVVRIGIGEYELGYVRDPSAALSTFHALLQVWHWHHSTDHYKENADVPAV
jgi:hypothetical protein